MLSIGLFASTIFLVSKINEAFLVEVPAYGGTLHEGVIGSPRFINPVLAISDADRDLTTLIYSGLLKANPDGSFSGDLAKSYSISEDGLTYVFTLKDDAKFHDGKPLTADDIIFTIQKAQDPDIKSPKRANWEGVTVEKVSLTEVKITLKQQYGPFLGNATLGILPKHIWKDIGADQFPFSQYNVEPIGSGPYRFESYKRTDAGIATSYTLHAFNEYIEGKPYISTIQLTFFQNEEEIIRALQDGIIKSVGTLTPTEADKIRRGSFRIMTTPLPRVFALFFNQNQAPVLMNHEVREALAMIIDKNDIVLQVLNGYGIRLDGPLSTLSGTTTKAVWSPEEASTTIKAAQMLLEKKGWKLGADGIYEKKTAKETQALAFSISTSNTPELKKAAEIIKASFEKIGAEISVKTFDQSELNQTVIRPRKYDALLFGEIVGHDPDLFAFWHSSQRNDPGLNIALYTNIKADRLLEQARTALNIDDRKKLYADFEKEIEKDIPAVFLFSPNFIYVVPQELHGIALGTLTTPSERFLSIPNWYIETEKVWSIFVPDANKETN